MKGKKITIIEDENGFRIEHDDELTVSDIAGLLKVATSINEIHVVQLYRDKLKEN